MENEKQLFINTFIKEQLKAITPLPVVQKQENCDIAITNYIPLVFQDFQDFIAEKESKYDNIFQWQW